MKKLVAALSLLTLLLAPSIVGAQGTMYVSNLGQTPTASEAFGSDFWIAQGFFISLNNPNTYNLNSVQLLMDPASGSPQGFTVSIYSGRMVNDDLGALSGPDPSAGGIYTYWASGITLTAGAYYVVVTSSTPVEQRAYNWSAVNSLTQNGTWFIEDLYATSANGSDWTPHSPGNVFQMAINATAIPEPSTWALFLAGGGFAMYVRARRPRPSVYKTAV